MSAASDAAASPLPLGLPVRYLRHPTPHHTTVSTSRGVGAPPPTQAQAQAEMKGLSLNIVFKERSSTPPPPPTHTHSWFRVSRPPHLYLLLMSRP